MAEGRAELDELDELDGLTVDPVTAYEVLSCYAAHPDLRAEPADGRAARRFAGIA